jgi:hypothetical protein
VIESIINIDQYTTVTITGVEAKADTPPSTNVIEKEEKEEKEETPVISVEINE